MRAAVTSLLLSAAALLPLCAAHICMWSPPQRGSVSVDGFASDSCAHKGPDPCGGVAAGQVRAKLVGGQQLAVQFQQQLNHWTGGNPGTLEVDLALSPNPSEADFRYKFGVIPDWNAMDEGTITNFTISGVVPNVASNHAVLRLAYRSNNPHEYDTSSDFFQCADVAITPNPALPLTEPSKRASAESEKKQQVKLSAPTDCCTPSQFETMWDGASSFDSYNGIGFTSFDGLNHLIFTSFPPDSNGKATLHYQNFTSGLEWVWTEDSPTCGLLGLDGWSDWCYGASQNMEYWDDVFIAGQKGTLWQNQAADMIFGATRRPDGSCLPLLRQRYQHRQMMLYYNTTLGILDPRIFVPPPECKRHAAYELSQGWDLRAVRSYAASLPRSTTHLKMARMMQGDQMKGEHAAASERVRTAQKAMAELQAKHTE